MVDYKYADLFYQENMDKQAKIEYSGGVMTNTELFQNSEEVKESLCSEKELRFGCCEASSFKFKVANIVKPMTGETVSFSIVVNHHEEDPFLVGRYKVVSDKEAADRRYRELVAYDAMYDILNADMAAWYNSILPEENSTVSLRQFRTSFIRHFGLTEAVPQGGLVNDSMTVERTINPEQISGKDIITAICEINGCFGHIGRDGKFHYIYLPQAIEGLYPANDLYPDHAPEWMVQAKTGHLYPQDPKSTRLGTGRYIKCQYEDYRTKRITKLQIRQKENDIGLIYGDGDNCYIIQDNFLVYGKSSEQLTVIAENIFGKITDIVYRPFDATCVGNPCLEVGDPVRLPTKYEVVESYILKRTMKGIQALRDSYAADGVEMYAEKLNGVQKSIIQLKGKSNILERTIEETRLEMRDEDAKLSNEITVTAKEIRGELKDEVNGLNNTISATAGEIRGELQDTKAGLETQISVTAKGLEANIQDTKKGLETAINTTAEGIRSDVSKTYETKTGAQTQYNSLSSSIRQTSEEISAEVNRATAAEGNLSSQLQLLGGQIVLKADANGRMVMVALNANPATGSEFKVDADNINLSANDVINLLAGGTLNLSAMNINITSNNWGVDSQGHMWCNSINAFQITGEAVNQFNNTLLNSAAMKRLEEILAIFEGRMTDVEKLLTNNKVYFGTLDGLQYAWRGANQQPMECTGGWSNTVDCTGYNKCIVRCKGDIGYDSSDGIAFHSYITLTFSNDPSTNNPATPTYHVVVADWGSSVENKVSGPAHNQWYNCVIDISQISGTQTVKAFSWGSGHCTSALLYVSKIEMTNM